MVKSAFFTFKMCLIFSVLLTLVYLQTLLTCSNENNVLPRKVRPSYTKDLLLHINKNCVVHRPSVDILSTLRRYGISSIHPISPTDNSSKCMNLKLKKKKKRGKRAGRKKQLRLIAASTIPDSPSSPDHAISPPHEMERHLFRPRPINLRNSIKLLYLNAQSIGEKTHTLNDIFTSSNADLIFVTETWMCPSGDEVKLTTLVPPYYTAASFPRLTGTGGGICVLIKNSFTNPRSRRVKFTTFECSRTEIIINNSLICLFCVYRPPPSKENKFTHSMFIDEFELFIDEHINLN